MDKYTVIFGLVLLIVAAILIAAFVVGSSLDANKQQRIYGQLETMTIEERELWDAYVLASLRGTSTRYRDPEVIASRAASYADMMILKRRELLGGRK